jgi:hypothetical protein
MQSAIAFSTYDLLIDPLIDQRSENFSALTISRNEEFETDALPEMFQHASSLIYQDRISQTFIIDSSSQQFSLIRGLIEFCRGSELNVGYDASQKRITIDFALKDSTSLQALLQNVSSRLEEELKFKQQLKRLIAFEARYRAESKTMYDSI